MARWQRRSSYAILVACGLTGAVWFALIDLYSLSPSKLTFWWITHGMSGSVALVVIGAALPSHVVAAWRAHRNRLWGAVLLVVLTLTCISALMLLYGPEPSHALAHWFHITAGIASSLALPWHVIRGRASVGRRQVSGPPLLPQD